MTSEEEGRAGASAAAVPDAAGGATEATTGEATTTEATTAEVTATAEAASEVTAAATGSADAVATTAIASTTNPTDTAADARDTPQPPDSARVRDSLEAIKTAVVWLAVIQLLTILSPLLRVSLKWTIIVGVVLTLSSFAVGGVAYMKARIAQRGFPE